MTLYHVSTIKYPPGKIVQVQPGTKSHFQQASARVPTKVRTEIILANNKPGGHPARDEAVFAFGDFSHCVHFGESEHGNVTKHYYEVEMSTEYRFPMALVDNVNGARDLSDEELEQLAQQYWIPTFRWQFWEYLDWKLSIVAEVRPSLGDLTAGAAYEEDRDLAMKFRRYVQTGHQEDLEQCENH